MMTYAHFRLVRNITAVVLLASVSVQAQSFNLNASSSETVPSFFTLDFGPGSQPSTAQISSTDLVLNVSATLGTARLVTYAQQVDPLTLPGGFSTGEITIEVVPDTSSGTFNPATREFTTSETYRIHFDDTELLPNLGLSSPVDLPGESSGIITFESGRRGTILNEWVGSTSIGLPGNEFTINYACTVNTRFEPQLVAPSVIDLMAAVASLPVSTRLGDALLGDLVDADDAINAGDNAAAANELFSFVRTVKNAARGRMAHNDALRLISGAGEVMSSLADRGIRDVR